MELVYVGIINSPNFFLSYTYNLQYRIAWVTYGPPDSLSSPLLCKRFFAEIAEVTNVIKAQDELYQLGVGTTHSGGTRGMAMLEGLVAAVEVRHV